MFLVRTFARVSTPFLIADMTIKRHELPWIPYYRTSAKRFRHFRSHKRRCTACRLEDRTFRLLDVREQLERLAADCASLRGSFHFLSETGNG
jgi:hypothetical protein